MNLLEARFSRRLSQWSLGQMCGLHQTRISLIEQGLEIDDEEKQKIARALAYQVEEIEWPKFQMPNFSKKEGS